MELPVNTLIANLRSEMNPLSRTLIASAAREATRDSVETKATRISDFGSREPTSNPGNG